MKDVKRESERERKKVVVVDSRNVILVARVTVDTTTNQPTTHSLYKVPETFPYSQSAHNASSSHCTS